MNKSQASKTRSGTDKNMIGSSGRDRQKTVVILVCMLPVIIASFIFTVTLFLHRVYSNMMIEAILFIIRSAAGGLAAEDIISGIEYTLLGILIAGGICFLLIRFYKKSRIILFIVMSFMLLTGSAAWFSSETGFWGYLAIKRQNSTIYEDHYVEPDDSILKFPDKKRNLIYIYLESMENTYASVENGGLFDIDYMSGLTDLTKESDSVSFSNTDTLGGASAFVPSISYTMGATVAQTSGVATDTLLFPLFSRAKFPPVKRLEDILHDNGYSQLYIEGSKGEFSMYDKYVGRYDDSRIFDIKSALERGYVDEKGDYIWKWGIEDQKLYEIAKELITKMSEEDRPFFVTLYTMDTHTFECGHRCANCDSGIKKDYLAAVDCSSRLTVEFVNWIKRQPFFENTTIILSGDHLGNEKTTGLKFDDGYERTIYNCIINPAVQPVSVRNRLFSSLDMFPTTLSAIGVRIKGDRLGLGTDLFSSTETLCEELGEEKYITELEKHHNYWD